MLAALDSNIQVLEYHTVNIVLFSAYQIADISSS